MGASGAPGGALLGGIRRAAAPPAEQRGAQGVAATGGHRICCKLLQAAASCCKLLQALRQLGRGTSGAAREKGR
eukprot:11510055-Alexandrium_andersonii.AAC.1